jgi:hypoxanthine phosphoribosyltransferase
MVSGLTEDITGRTVVIVEDIVDTGHTLKQPKSILQECNPAEIKVATLLFKPESLKCDVTIDYVALDIPPAFIVGYGLDYDDLGRNLKDIYSIVQD